MFQFLIISTGSFHLAITYVQIIQVTYYDLPILCSSKICDKSPSYIA